MGFPEGLEPPMFCPETGCMGHMEECLRLKRALGNMEHLEKYSSLPFVCGKKGGQKDEYIVRMLDSNIWMRCCVTGAPGKEESKCGILFEKVLRPPPFPPPIQSKSRMSFLWKSLKKGLWKLISNLLNLKAWCGMYMCGATDEYPPPICLDCPKPGMFAMFNRRCVWQGRNHQLQGYNPKTGMEKSKVFIFAAPTPELAITWMPTERAALRRTRGQEFLKHSRNNRHIGSTFL